MNINIFIRGTDRHIGRMQFRSKDANFSETKGYNPTEKEQAANPDAVSRA